MQALYWNKIYCDGYVCLLTDNMLVTDTIKMRKVDHQEPKVVPNSQLVRSNTIIMQFLVAEIYY